MEEPGLASPHRLDSAPLSFITAPVDVAHGFRAELQAVRSTMAVSVVKICQHFHTG